MAKASRVMIDGKLYVVGKTGYRSNSGWFYWVSGEEGENCMTIPAYPPGTSVWTQGHHLLFDKK